jgi:hypothetical protein
VKKIVIVVILCVFLCSDGFARAVSYKGGWTLLTMNDEDSDSLYVHYSPEADYSVGIKGEYFRDRKYVVNLGQLNVLVKRWNMTGWQANIYVKSGVGGAVTADNASNVRGAPALMSAFAADWESRRYYLSYEAQALYAGDIDFRCTQKGRVGIAPYIGRYGDVHTWLMAEVRYEPTRKNDKFMVTPLVRFFKGSMLAEIGADYKGNIMANWIMYF